MLFIANSAFLHLVSESTSQPVGGPGYIMGHWQQNYLMNFTVFKVD